MFRAIKQGFVVGLFCALSLVAHAQTDPQVKVVVVPLQGDEAPKEKVIFITKKIYTNGDLGGLAGADADCQADADAAGSKVQGKTFKAWLGGPVTDPLAGQRAFNVFDYPYVSPNGDPIADSYKHLLTLDPWPFLSLAADGTDVTSIYKYDGIITGRSFDGQVSSTCQGYTDTTGTTTTATFYELDRNARQFGDGMLPCGDFLGPIRWRVACFEQ